MGCALLCTTCILPKFAVAFLRFTGLGFARAPGNGVRTIVVPHGSVETDCLPWHVLAEAKKRGLMLRITFVEALYSSSSDAREMVSRFPFFYGDSAEDLRSREHGRMDRREIKTCEDTLSVNVLAPKRCQGTSSFDKEKLRIVRLMPNPLWLTRVPPERENITFEFENWPDGVYDGAELILGVGGGLELPDLDTETRRLIERCNCRDEQAWEEFYARYHGIVCIAVRKHCAKFPTLVEDIVQEVFCALFAALKSYDWTKSIIPYIHAVARNVAISRIRELNAVTRGGGNPTEPFGGDDPPGIDPSFQPDDPLDLLMRAQEEHLLRKARETLEESCQKLIDLRFHECKSYSEISLVLGVKETTLRSQVKRCLLALRANYRKLSLQKGGRSW